MSEPTLIYHSGTQTGKFRFLLYFSLLCFIASVAGLYWIGFTPQPGMSAEERWALALVVLAVGAGFFGGMLVYARRYVVWLWLDEEVGEITIETMRLIGEHEVRLPLTNLVAADHEAGVLVTGRHRIRTPYLKLGVKGQRLPFVVDLQGHVSEEKLFWQLVERVSSSRPTQAIS